MPGADVPVFLVDNPHFFHRDGIYTDPATGEEVPSTARTGSSASSAALSLEYLDQVKPDVDIIHCHDSHTATCTGPAGPAGGGCRPAAVPAAGHPAHHPQHRLSRPHIRPRCCRRWGSRAHVHSFRPFEYYGQVNFLKIGIHYADLVNTVSVRYAQEIQSRPSMATGSKASCGSAPRMSAS